MCKELNTIFFKRPFHVIHTFSPSLPAPAHTLHPCHLHTSTGTQSSTFLCSRCPNHLNLPCLTTLATPSIPERLQIFTLLSILQRHSTHPSHHHILCPLQTTQIFSLHCPCFSPICQHTLDTSSVYKLFPFIWRTSSTGCQDEREPPEPTSPSLPLFTKPILKQGRPHCLVQSSPNPHCT